MARSRSSAPSLRASSVLGLDMVYPSGYDASRDGKLLRGEPQGLLGHLLLDAGDLEHDAPRLDHCCPVLYGGLAASHSGLLRLLGHRLIREDTDPDLPPSASVVGDGPAGGLDLPGADPGGLQGLEGKLPEHRGVAGMGQAPAAAPVLLTIL